MVSQDVTALAREGGAERRFERGGRDWVHFANKRRRGFIAVLWRLAKAHTQRAAVLGGAPNAGALKVLQMTCVARCPRRHGNITERSPILTSSVLAAFEGVRRVRHRSRR